MSGPDVDVVRRKLGFPEAGKYDRSVQAKVMGVAKKRGIETRGEVNQDVAEELGPAADEDQAPEWWPEDRRDLKQFDMGPEVKELNKLLNARAGMRQGEPQALDEGDDRFREDTEAAVKRFQSSKGLDPTGIVDLNLAKSL